MCNKIKINSRWRQTRRIHNRGDSEKTVNQGGTEKKQGDLGKDKLGQVEENAVKNWV